MDKNKDIVIAAMEFAREKFMQGLSFDKGELSNYLFSQKYFEAQNVGDNDGLVTALYDQIMSHRDTHISIRRWMSLDAYLGLLDYEELQLAREDSARAREEAKQAIKNATDATRFAKKALVWTIISAVMASVIGIIQIVIALNGK